MSDFIQRYKNKIGGAKGKDQGKSGKKQTTKALFQALKLSSDCQIAGILHDGRKYVMLSEDKMNELIQNGGRILSTPEQKQFNAQYQVLLQLMANMDNENEDENDLFTELDQLTFDFSDAMNGTKETRKRVTQTFEDLINGNEKLIELYKQLEPQVKGLNNQPENQGKLT